MSYPRILFLCSCKGEGEGWVGSDPQMVVPSLPSSFTFTRSSLLLFLLFSSLHSTELNSILLLLPPLLSRVQNIILREVPPPPPLAQRKGRGWRKNFARFIFKSPYGKTFGSNKKFSLHPPLFSLPPVHFDLAHHPEREWKTEEGEKERERH